jgi:hypothetical protein
MQLKHKMLKNITNVALPAMNGANGKVMSAKISPIEIIARGIR